jgi:hypothetical protein
LKTIEIPEKGIPRIINNDLQRNITNKNIGKIDRGVNEIREVYQQRIYIVEDENSDPLANSQSTLKRWRFL